MSAWIAEQKVSSNLHSAVHTTRSPSGLCAVSGWLFGFCPASGDCGCPVIVEWLKLLTAPRRHFLRAAPADRGAPSRHCRPHSPPVPPAANFVGWEAVGPRSVTSSLTEYFPALLICPMSSYHTAEPAGYCGNRRRPSSSMYCIFCTVCSSQWWAGRHCLAAAARGGLSHQACPTTQPHSGRKLVLWNSSDTQYCIPTSVHTIPVQNILIHF